MSNEAKKLILPESLISSIDLSRLTRELAALDEQMHQANLRGAGEPTKVSRSSRILEEVAARNNVSLLNAEHRAQLIHVLQAFDKHAPRIHMSFATEPSAKFTHRIIIWLRENINPQILLEIGLQPTLAAGAMVRTTNKVFDLSLRQHFADNKHLLNEKIAEFKDPPKTEVMPAPQETAA